MEEKMNYPIKYGVLMLIEPEGWPIGTKMSIKGYIPSKCYLVESSIRYYPDGTSQNFHQVVFPYEDFYKFKMALAAKQEYYEQPRVPRHSFDGSLYPISTIPCYYGTYKEAAEAAIVKNQELHAKMISTIDLSTEQGQKRYEEVNRRFMNDMAVIDKYEQYVSLKKEEMAVTPEAVKTFKIDQD